LVVNGIIGTHTHTHTTIEALWLVLPAGQKTSEGLKAAYFSNMNQESLQNKRFPGIFVCFHCFGGNGVGGFSSVIRDCLHREEKEEHTSATPANPWAVTPLEDLPFKQHWNSLHKKPVDSPNPKPKLGSNCW